MRDLAKQVAESMIPHSIMVRLRARQAKKRGDNPELMLLPDMVQGGAFVDIGANIGDYSRVAALLFPRVHTFEPIPYLVEKLKRELPANVVVSQVALSDAPGKATLYIPQEGKADVTGLASLLPDAVGGKHALREIEVEVRTLDSYGLGRIDAIKIDVEGFEQSVLAGAAATIGRDHPAMVIEIEDRHHPGRTLSVFEVIWGFGYRSYVLEEGHLVEVGLQSPHWAGVPEDQALINRGRDGRYTLNFVFLHPKRPFTGLLG